MKFILIALVVLASSCTSASAGIGYPPVVLVEAPDLPQMPHPGIDHVASAVCDGESDEFCVIKTPHVRTVWRNRKTIRYACPVADVGINGLKLVPVGPIQDRNFRLCENLGLHNEVGFKGVSDGESRTIVYLKTDEATGTNVVDLTCTYTMHGSRQTMATVDADCT